MTVPCGQGNCAACVFSPVQTRNSPLHQSLPESPQVLAKKPRCSHDLLRKHRGCGSRDLAFMANRGARTKYITSVCSGSLILLAAGLLKGYKATSHWSVRHVLAGFGAIPTDARVVRDRNLCRMLPTRERVRSGGCYQSGWVPRCPMDSESSVNARLGGPKSLTHSVST
jgi:hypothetical protein